MTLRKRIRAAMDRAVEAIDGVVSPRYRVVPLNQVHTLSEQAVLRKLIGYFEVDCIFDVGANVGQYATMLRDKVGYTGHIVSFEPIPDCARRLRELARTDGKWHVEEVALSETAGEASFNVMASTQFSSLSRPAALNIDKALDQNRVSSTVNVRLDTLASQYRRHVERLRFRRPFLKMDTQGNDIRVATGGQAVLDNFVGLQSELAVIPIYEGMPSYIEAIAFYEARGFQLSALVPNNAGHFPHLIELDCIMSNKRMIG